MQVKPFQQNLAGASNGTIRGAHGGVQQLGQAAQRRLGQPGGGIVQPPPGGAPTIPMPPAGGGGPTIPMPPPVDAAPLPGFQPAIGRTPPTMDPNQRPGGPDTRFHLNPGADGGQSPPIVNLPGQAPTFGQAGQQLGTGMDEVQGAQGPFGGGGGGSQMANQVKGIMNAPGGPGQISTAGGMPSGDPSQMARQINALPGFMPAGGGMAPPVGIHLPGGPGQISLHGSPMMPGQLPTKPMAGGMAPPNGGLGAIGGGGGMRQPGKVNPLAGNRY